MPGINDRLRSIFGWRTKRPSMALPKEGDPSQLGNPQSLVDAYNRALEVPETRLDLYNMYNQIDEGLMSAVLDSMAADATQYDTEHRAKVWVEGKDSSTTKVLEGLLDRLQIDEQCESIVRDMAKSGDDFMRLDIQTLPEEDTIVGSGDPGKQPRRIEYWNPMDPRRVVRYETQNGILVGFDVDNIGSSSVPKLPSPEEDQSPALNPWEMVHFRLMRRKFRRFDQTMSRNIYGTSVVHAAIRSWRQMRILEDLLMMHRMLRSLDRHVYRIDVGHAAREDEIRILKKWKNSLKRKPWIDPTSDQFSSRYDPMCLTGDTKISLLNGTEVAIRDLVGVPEFWVYSTTPEGKIVPGRGHSARYTKTAQVYKITLDNGESVRCTDNHPFMMRDGSYVHADQLKPGDSLMPLYRRSDEKGYEEVLHPGTGVWEKTHHVVCEAYAGMHRHHRDLDKRNNEPTNLVSLSFHEHSTLHASIWRENRDVPRDIAKKQWTNEDHARFMSDMKKEHWKDDDYRNLMSNTGSDTMNKLWERTDFKQARSECLATQWLDPEFREMKQAHTSMQMKKRWSSPDRKRCHQINRCMSVLTKCRYSEGGKISRTVWDVTRDASRRDPTFDTALRYIPEYLEVNHKVLSIELVGMEDVYDISVDTWHNFALTAGTTCHNSWIEDIFWPVREGSQSNVETLQGQPNPGSIVDFDAFVNKFFGVMQVPKEYFIQDQSSGSIFGKATLAQQDIKYARIVTSLQHHFLNGLTRLCQIELALRNMDPNPKNFTVKMSKVSWLEEQQRVEVMETLVNSASTLLQFGQTAELNMREWIPHVLSSTLGMGNSEIRKFFYSADQQPGEGDYEVEPTPPEGEEPDGSETQEESTSLTEIRKAIEKTLGKPVRKIVSEL